MRKISALFLLALSLTSISVQATTIIDRNGNVTNTRKDYYDSGGRSQGHSEKSPYSNRTDHYDSWGRKEGHSESTYSGEVRHYDSWGRYQGSTRNH